MRKREKKEGIKRRHVTEEKRKTTEKTLKANTED